jgi:serine/threonine protein kinase
VRLSSSKATPENFGITDAGFFDDDRRTRTISGQHDEGSFNSSSGASPQPAAAVQEWTPTPRAIVGSLAASEDPDSSVNYDYFGTVGRGGFAKVTLVSSRRSSPCTSRNGSRRGSFDATASASAGAPGTPAAADRCCAVAAADTTDYAVKVCSKRSSASRCEMARREAKLLRELRRHPFIVTLR